MNEIKAIIAAVILAAVAYFGWSYAHMRGELKVAVEAAQTAQDNVKRLQAASALRGKLRATTARQTASRDTALAAAAASAPEWRDEPVPQEVQDALTR